MGGGSSTLEEEYRREAFTALVKEFEAYDEYTTGKKKGTENSEPVAVEDDASESSWPSRYESENEEDTEGPKASPRTRVMEGLRPALNQVRRARELAGKTVFIDLVDLEAEVERAFNSEITPVILDASPDDKVNTFYSYQTDVITFNAKSMVVAGSKALAENMEELRRHLVMAMKHGKTLHIRLGTSAPDFKGTFTDEQAERKITTAPGIYGDVDTELKGYWERIHAKVGLDMEVLQEAAKARNERFDISTYTAYGHVHGMVPELRDQKAYFPGIALRRCGVSLYHGQDYWVPRLYREKDIRPHKNFAFCKPGFRIFLSSSMSLVDAAQFLFDYKVDKDEKEHGGDGFGGGLPPMQFFRLISVNPESPAHEDQEDQGG